MLLRVISSLNLMLVTVAGALTAIFAYPQLATERLKPYGSEAGDFEVTYPIEWSTATNEKGDSLVVIFTSCLLDLKG